MLGLLVPLVVVPVVLERERLWEGRRREEEEECWWWRRKVVGM
jgi:hypothetical protein